ncbi:hypothetical protein GCM10027174_24210 [Salinifilum aidingensis]
MTTTSLGPRPVRSWRTHSGIVFLLTVLTATLTPPSAAAPAPLPLGDPDLAESRTTKTLTTGVTLTEIVRGSEPAAPEEIGTTSRGPWRVHVLSIDPRAARGHLRATYGPDLGQTEKTTQLVESSGALAGVNASFFTFTDDRRYPGDPVGLGVHSGHLLSEPTGSPAEANFLVDSASGEVLMGRLEWSGVVRNRHTGQRLTPDHINHPPAVPEDCGGSCDKPGDLVLFTPEFSSSTPEGRGIEVVLDHRGCPQRTLPARGTALAEGETSLQATGANAAKLRAAAEQGCFTRHSSLTDQDGDTVPLRRSLFGVTGRYRLVEGGEIVVPDGEDGGLFARNPRTLGGTTADGTIKLVTIDGRQTTSVGTTMDETAAVAHALGLTDAVNLDGGGSTSMSTDRGLVNQPSGSAERAVGDALVYRDTPFHPETP